jgi:hypothetical protein
MNRRRSTGVLLVGWGRGSGGLPFPDPLYYYQVDFHSSDHYFGERLYISCTNTCYRRTAPLTLFTILPSFAGCHLYTLQENSSITLVYNIGLFCRLPPILATWVLLSPLCCKLWPMSFSALTMSKCLHFNSGYSYLMLKFFLSFLELSLQLCTALGIALVRTFAGLPARSCGNGSHISS